MSANPITHIPVLRKEAIELLDIKPTGLYIDCTVGTGGHAAAILDKGLPDGQLLGLDLDPEALEITKARLQGYGRSILLVNESYRNLQDICNQYNFQPVHGIILDLGVSSLHFDDFSRGFSFRFDTPLDMRFNPEQSLTAATIVNTYTEVEIASLLKKYGEERNYQKIARNIVGNRPINTTFQLVKVIEKAIGAGKASGKNRINPATLTFQALRIAVNEELVNLEKVLKQTTNLLVPGGRLVVISYHSLEDRLVKDFMRLESKGCICPPEIPVCVCKHAASLKLINHKVITPSLAEIGANPRSRSAKLRSSEHL